MGQPEQFNAFPSLGLGHASRRWPPGTARSVLCVPLGSDEASTWGRGMARLLACVNQRAERVARRFLSRG